MIRLIWETVKDCLENPIIIGIGIVIITLIIFEVGVGL